MKRFNCILSIALLTSLVPVLGSAQEGGGLELGKADITLQDNLDARLFRESIRIVLGDTLSGIDDGLVDQLFEAVDADRDGFISEQELDESVATVRDGTYGLVIGAGTVTVMAYRRTEPVAPDVDIETPATEVDDDVHR